MKNLLTKNKKRGLISLILCFALLLNPSISFAVVDFVSTLNLTAEDYTTMQLWEDAIDDAGDLTDSTVFCGSWDTKVGSTVGDATAVDWDGGASTGTLIHMTESNGSSAGDQYMIDVTAGSLADDDTILDVATSTDGFSINGAPDSCAIVLEIHSDDGDVTGDLHIDGLTTSVDNHVRITSPESDRHTGIFNTGTTIVFSAGDDGMTFNDSHVRVEWLELDGSNLTDKIIEQQNGTVSSHLRYLLVTDDNGVLSGVQLVWNSMVYNSVFLNIGAGNRKTFTPTSGHKHYVSNVTMYGGADGFSELAGDQQFTNVLCMNYSETCFALFETGELNYSMSDDGTADDFGGTGNVADLTDYSSYFVNTTTDFHLKAGSAFIDAGNDQSGDSELAFSDDLDGVTRSGTWDSGADEFVASSGPRIITIF